MLRINNKGSIDFSIYLSIYLSIYVKAGRGKNEPGPLLYKNVINLEKRGQRSKFDLNNSVSMQCPGTNVHSREISTFHATIFCKGMVRLSNRKIIAFGSMQKKETNAG